MENLILRNAKIIFNNFAGNPSKFDKEGKQSVTFDVTDAELPDEWEDATKDLVNDDTGEIKTILSAKIHWGTRPPIIKVVEDGKIIEIIHGSDELKNVSQYICESADVVLRPYTYEVAGRKGVTTYVRTLYIHIVNDDPFADDYESTL